MATKTTAEKLATIQQGYTLEGATIELGAAIIDGELHKDAPVRLPLAMMNRHGLVAGATGTGKTVTLHMMAEQLSTAGVPVFLADIKGDLSGLATAAAGSEKLTARTQSIGQDVAGEDLPGGIPRPGRRRQRHPRPRHRHLVRAHPALAHHGTQRHPGIQPAAGLLLRGQERPGTRSTSRTSAPSSSTSPRTRARTSWRNSAACPRPPPA